MGREYFYCFRCQLRLEGEDLDFGRAVRIREKVVCEKCIGDVIAPMTFKEQEEILLALKSARERRQDAARAERPKRETSTRVRIPAAIRPPGPPPPIKLPPSTNSNAGAVIFLMGALCLLVALGALYYVFGSNEYQAPPPLPPPAPPPFDS